MTRVLVRDRNEEDERDTGEGHVKIEEVGK